MRSVGQDAPQAPHHIADMRRPAAKTEIRETHELRLGALRARRYGRPRSPPPERLGVEPPLLQDLGEHGGGGLVEHGPPADSRESARRPPSPGQARCALDHRQAAVLVFLRGLERGKAACCLSVLVVLLHLAAKLGEPAARLEIGKIVQHLLHRRGRCARPALQSSRPRSASCSASFSPLDCATASR